VKVAVASAHRYGSAVAAERRVLRKLGWKRRGEIDKHLWRGCTHRLDSARVQRIADALEGMDQRSAQSSTLAAAD
jgi:hypothetical protein